MPNHFVSNSPIANKLDAETGVFNNRFVLECFADFFDEWGGGSYSYAPLRLIAGARRKLNEIQNLVPIYWG